MNVEDLIVQNTHLIHYVLRHYIHVEAIWYEDMYSIGLIGLVKAAKSFDPTLGYAFSTYAISFIKHSILHEIRDKKRRHLDVISLYDITYHGKDGRDLTVEDMIASDEDVPTEVFNDNLEIVMDDLLSNVTDEHRDMVTDWLYAEVYGYTPYTQWSLAIKYNTNQVKVSRTLKAAKKMMQHEVMKWL